MKSEKSLGHTIGAIFVCIIVYLLMIYIVTPVLDKIMTLFGIFFVPERYGGGSEAQNPGLLQLIFQGLIQNGISAYCAIKASMAAFSNANNKGVAASLMIFVGIGAIIFTYVLFQKDGLFALIVPLTLAPTIYFSIELWKNDYI